MEKIGQISRINRFVLEQRCAFIQTLEEKNAAAVPVAVNISPFDIIRLDFAGDLQAIMTQHNVHCSQIHLELTENSLLEIPDLVQERIQELTALGYTIIIDDFGKGYSSLSELKALAVSNLKIDKSFLENVPNTPSTRDPELFAVYPETAMDLLDTRFRYPRFEPEKWIERQVVEQRASCT